VIIAIGPGDVVVVVIGSILPDGVVPECAPCRAP
jgi:hypothetical protein